jgi:hypothetical protein
LLTAEADRLASAVLKEDSDQRARLLGTERPDVTAANIEFEHSLVRFRGAGGQAGGDLNTVMDYYQQLHPARMISRRSAFSIGRGVGHPELMAWAVEMLAWIALIDEHFPTAAKIAHAAQDLTRMGTSVMVQLAVQEAKAWSQLRARRDAETALEHQRVRLLSLRPLQRLSIISCSTQVSSCSSLRPASFWLGQNDRAEEHAHEVITQSQAAGRLTRVAEHISTSLWSRCIVVRSTSPLTSPRGLSAVPRLCATTLGRLKEFHRALFAHRDRFPAIPRLP